MKKFLALLLALVMVLSMVSVASAEEDILLIAPNPTATNTSELSDISSHWAEKVIKDLYNAGYVNGMGDGTYAPDAQVTRAQFIKMATELFDDELSEYKLAYADIKGDEWFAPYIQKADFRALIHDAMKINGEIKPNTPITREEAASVAARVAEQKGAKKDNADITFTDEDDISNWAKDAHVKDAVLYGIIKGYDTGEFKPKANITRAEAAQILLRMIEIDSRVQIYVDADNGNDKNKGTKEAPLKTVEAARDLAKDYAPEMKNDISVYLRGKFRIENTLEFKPENSGGNGYSINYTSWDDEKAVLTMADEYTGFQLHDEDKNIWKVYVGKDSYSRQAYFNDVRGIRARTISRLENCEYVDDTYFLCDNEELLDIKYPKEVEAIYYILWTNPRFLIDKISEQDGRVRFDLHPHFARNNYSHQYRISSKSPQAVPAFLENAYEFLDDKGEWYMNKHDGYLYYIPRTGEDMTNMTVKLPKGERLINACGTDADNTVSNLSFDNLCLEGVTWFKVERDGGYNDHQNGHIQEKNEEGKYNTGVAPGAAIHFEHCRNISMTNNTIRQMGRVAVDFMVGSKHVDVIGNEFYDIGGCAIMVDDVALLGSPAKRPEDTWCEYVRVNNNYIHNTALECRSSAAIAFAWPRHSEFNHNEITATSYSGFHIGYGWYIYGETGTIMYDTEVSYNYIHNIMTDRLSDGGSIYTLGASSLECEKLNTEKNNREYGNYVANSWAGAMIYPDEGSTSWHIKGNVIDTSLLNRKEGDLTSTAIGGKPFGIHMHADSIKWMTVEDNYSTVDYAYANGHMNQRESVVEPFNMLTPKDWENWPQEAKDIMEFAGIEDEYKDNFNLDGEKAFACAERRQPLNLEEPTPAQFYILGGKNKQFDIKNYEFDVWTDDPEAIELTSDGNWIAHKKGTHEAEVAVTMNGFTHLVHVVLDCGDEVEELVLNMNSVNILAGATVDISVSGKYTFGSEIDVTDKVEYELKPDAPIVSVERADLANKTALQVKALADEGETVLRGYVAHGDMRKEIEIPVRIISYGGNEEATKLPFTKVDLTVGWKHMPVPTEDGGARVYGTPNYQSSYHNQLMAFDMMCTPGSTWPSFTFCDNDKMGDYKTNDCYMIGFKDDHIEFQKFNKGVRSMIFGEPHIAWNVLSGPGIPNTGDNKIFEYNKRYSIVVGALDTEEGTRIILNINGKNIIDYTDDTDKKLPAEGNFGIYNPEKDTQNGLYAGGGFTFWPYTGITD